MPRLVPKIELYIRNRTATFLLKKSVLIVARSGPSYWFNHYLKRKTDKILHRVTNAPLLDIRVNGTSLLTPIFVFSKISKSIGRKAALSSLLSYRVTLKQLTYLAWIEKNEVLNDKTISRSINLLKYKPLFSILVYCTHTNRHVIKKNTFSSIEQQHYRNYEMIPVKDDIVNAVKNSDGEYVIFLECGTELALNAISEFAKAVNKDPSAEYIYSDEDRFDKNGLRTNPFFKPEWSPDLMRTFNYVGSSFCAKRSAVRSAGLSLAGKVRLNDSIPGNKVVHIPKVLIHNEAPSKNEQRRESLVSGSVHASPKFGNSAPEVTIIIPFKDKPELLEACVESIRNKTDYPNFNILLVNNRSKEEKTFACLGRLSTDERIRVLDYNQRFNYSAINNFAVKRSKSELVVLLNNDTEVISRSWLSEMVSEILKEGAGAVGARLLYKDGTIQHAGVAIGLGGAAGHVFRNLDREREGYFNLDKRVRNVSAVTAACMLTKRSIFEEAGGLDEENFAVTYSDTDYCLKLIERGYRIIYTPHAELYHYESVSRGKLNDPKTSLSPSLASLYNREYRAFKKKWAKYIAHDPYYSPNLTREREDYSLTI